MCLRSFSLVSDILANYIVCALILANSFKHKAYILENF